MSSSTPAVASESGGPPSDAEQAYMEVLRIRLFEEAAQRLFMQNEIEGSIHLYDGQEAVAVGVNSALDVNDSWITSYRYGSASSDSMVSPETSPGRAGGRE